MRGRRSSTSPPRGKRDLRLPTSASLANTGTTKNHTAGGGSTRSHLPRCFGRRYQASPPRTRGQAAWTSFPSRNTVAGSEDGSNQRSIPRMLSVDRAGRGRCRDRRLSLGGDADDHDDPNSAEATTHRSGRNVGGGIPQAAWHDPKGPGKADSRLAPPRERDRARQAKHYARHSAPSRPLVQDQPGVLAARPTGVGPLPYNPFQDIEADR